MLIRLFRFGTILGLALMASVSQAGPRHKDPVRSLTQKKTVQEKTEVTTPYDRAIKALRAGRIAEAQDFLREQLGLTPGNLDALRLLVRLLIDAGNEHEAEALLAESLVPSSKSLDLVQSLAVLRAERGALGLAAETLREGLSYAEGDGAYRAYLASLLQKQGRHEEASELFVQALDISPGNGLWQLALAKSRDALGDVSGACEQASLALAGGQLSSMQRGQAKHLLRRLALRASKVTE